NSGTISLVRNCTFLNNRGAYGGALHNSGTAINVTATIFVKNFARSEGGAVYNEGTMGFVKCAFSSNYASRGGGIYSQIPIGASSSSSSDSGGLPDIGVVTIESSSFFNNSANSTGGAIHSKGFLLVEDTRISGGTAMRGGGVFADDMADGFSSVMKCLFMRCTFSDLSALGQGGAIFALGGSHLECDDCAFEDAAAPKGGAVFLATATNHSSAKTFTASTFSRCSADVKGGAFYTNVDISVAGCNFSVATAGEAGGGIYANSDSAVTLTG
ncbi:unnamed protein product, partial [Phaeothamnion confervicola]